MKIKICGLTRIVDIEAANTAKPDFVGFVFAESRRKVESGHARFLRSHLAEGIEPVGVFVNEPINNILDIADAGIINMIQLHGSEDESYIRRLKDRCGIPLIKAIAVAKSGDVQEWQESCADYLLLDNKGGGTGAAFDWSLIGSPAKPFFLAGGLSISNIDEAIKSVEPYAIDVSSGVETNGLKDIEKITAIVRRVHNG
ncbi:MAG: phosphoribosylanthranilate isomerase [Eubacteriaceae bacterium]|nr:phosphoribosylanthranilate isomerase [Eubacteriaceae bacterium]